MEKDKKAYRILVIEDNPGDFTLVEDFLFEQIKRPVITHAASYKAATDILFTNENKFDIVLLDLSLPDNTGESLILGIVEHCSQAPIIVLTGYADFTFGIKSLSLGVSDYILKEELTALSLYKSIIYSSERKKIAAALEESEKKYSEMFHLSPLPIFVFELETLAFLDVNDAFLKHYGYTKDELFLMDMNGIRPPEEPEEIPAFEADHLQDNPNKRSEQLGVYRHRKKNGEVIQVDILSNFIRYKGKNAKVTIAADVTERLNYIKAIETQNEKLREISWIQSHVVRAPLARIMGLIPLVKDLQEDNDLRDQMFEYLISSANELDEMIKSITDKTRIADYQLLRNK
ncbi:PAS domain S-box protein [Mucilaginibacter sp.]